MSERLYKITALMDMPNLHLSKGEIMRLALSGDDEVKLMHMQTMGKVKVELEGTETKEVYKYHIIRVKDRRGLWYNNAYIENEKDAVRVAEYYRDVLGYAVQIWLEDIDVTSQLLS